MVLMNRWKLNEIQQMQIEKLLRGLSYLLDPCKIAKSCFNTHSEQTPPEAKLSAELLFQIINLPIGQVCK